MTVTSGLLQARLPGGEWQSYPGRQLFRSGRRTAVSMYARSGDRAYLCEYLGG